jgi:60 kDa SS-A/Ro ribonucleoprotein
MKNTYASAAYNINPTNPSTVAEPIIGREPDMAQNNGGGFSFVLDKWAMLDRFLIIGTEGGTYYVSENKVTEASAKNVIACIKEDSKRVVDAIIDVSHNGRAMKNEPALFALALVASYGDEYGRKYALSVLPRVARIGTHLFSFVEYVNSMRGWGRGLRNSITNWYLDKPVEAMVLQLVKYQSRNGWSHRDVLRLAHIKPLSEDQNLAFRWSTHRLDKNEMIMLASTNSLALINAFERIKATSDENTIVDLVTRFNIPMELIPTEKRSTKVLEAVFDNLGITALIRNLSVYSSKGMLENYSEMSKKAITKITDANILKKGRIHPMFVLNALVTYSNGRGMKGNLSWNVNQNIVDALDEAYYMSFDAVEPTGKNIFLGLDVSGSMGWGNVMGMSLIPRQIVAAMAMVALRTEAPTPWVYGFGSTLQSIGLNKKMRLDAVINKMSSMNFGSTNPGLTFEYATKNNLPVDAFVIMTDNEINSGHHPHQLLEKYRQKSGRAARFITVGTTATNFSIADPSDKYSIDICGFDTSTPQFMSNFIKND